MTCIRLAVGIALAWVAGAQAQQAPSGRRSLALDDLHRLRDVSEPQVSPDGAWVAYTVSAADTAKDRANADIYMTSWDGRRTLRLTRDDEGEHAPRWSPDGRYLSFLSSRGDPHEADQLWLLDRSGGEAERVTNLAGGVSGYDWSPDGRRVALIVSDSGPSGPDGGGADEGGADSAAKEKAPKPIVIDRLQFKEDVTGYLEHRRDHLYVLDVATREARQILRGDQDEALPAWSPDGRQIAFVSKRGKDPDRGDDFNLYVVEPRPGAAPRQLTTFSGADMDPDWGSRSPAWSPDGRLIAYVQGGPSKLIYYGGHSLAVVPAAGGAARVLTPTLDRNPLSPAWSADGRTIHFLLEDDRVIHLASVPAGGGPVTREVGGRRTVSDFSVGGRGRVALTATDPSHPAEVYAVDGGRLRALSHQNDSLLAAVRLGPEEEIAVRSRDGTEVRGFVVRPPDYQPGRRYPAVLRIHGGPVWQFYNEFAFDWQLLAARGYVVLGVNPRGSSGRGEKYSTAIWADWGNKDSEDVLAAVDWAVARGLADPARLGVGGWSYGGILTNQVIARDRRFKAATSGAGQSNALAGYGTDQYVREYEAELGTPWKNTDVWLRVSYPFLHADRIVTPTLFLCGDQDFNVPLLNSEQMYQALRSLGRETQLVIYPGEHHDISRPSHQRDRLERYLAWYGKYLRPEGGTSRVSAAEAAARRGGPNGP